MLCLFALTSIFFVVSNFHGSEICRLLFPIMWSTLSLSLKTHWCWIPQALCLWPSPACISADIFYSGIFSGLEGEGTGNTQGIYFKLAGTQLHTLWENWRLPLWERHRWSIDFCFSGESNRFIQALKSTNSSEPDIVFQVEQVSRLSHCSESWSVCTCTYMYVLWNKTWNLTRSK